MRKEVGYWLGGGFSVLIDHLIFHANGGISLGIGLIFSSLVIAWRLRR